MILVKIHQAYRYIVAVCDSDLIGRKFDSVSEEGIEMQLDLTGSFFNGEEKSSEEVREIMLDALGEDASFNIVGEESCGLAKKVQLIKDSGIIFIHELRWLSVVKT